MITQKERKSNQIFLSMLKKITAIILTVVLINQIWEDLLIALCLTVLEHPETRVAATNHLLNVMGTVIMVAFVLPIVI